jgi:hypothetical protein
MTRKSQIIFSVLIVAFSAVAQDTPIPKTNGSDRTLARLPEGHLPPRPNYATNTAQIRKENIALKATSVKSSNVKIITTDGALGYMVSPTESVDDQTLGPLNPGNSQAGLAATSPAQKELTAQKSASADSKIVKIITTDDAVGYVVTPVELIIADK